MKLWTQWLQAVYALRPACSRARTFMWTTFVLMGLCCRADNAGVTSFVRVLNFSGQAYRRFLHLFHSISLDLDVLTSCWVRLCLVLFRPFEVHSRLVCLADGIKAPKEGRRMPGVKYLHKSSASNTKPEYIMGHSLQAISLLVHSGGAQVAALPLTSRIHEGLVFSNRDARTLLDKFVALLFCIARACDRKVYSLPTPTRPAARSSRPFWPTGINCQRVPRATPWPICPCPNRSIVARDNQKSTVKKFASKISPKTTRPSSAPPVRFMASAMSRCDTACWT